MFVIVPRRSVTKRPVNGLPKVVEIMRALSVIRPAPPTIPVHGPPRIENAPVDGLMTYTLSPKPRSVPSGRGSRSSMPKVPGIAALTSAAAPVPLLTRSSPWTVSQAYIEVPSAARPVMFANPVGPTTEVAAVSLSIWWSLVDLVELIGDDSVELGAVPGQVATERRQETDGGGRRVAGVHPEEGDPAQVVDVGVRQPNEAGGRTGAAKHIGDLHRGGVQDEPLAATTTRRPHHESIAAGKQGSAARIAEVDPSVPLDPGGSIDFVDAGACDAEESTIALKCHPLDCRSQDARIDVGRESRTGVDGHETHVERPTIENSSDQP